MFHVVHVKIQGWHIGYEIYLNNKPVVRLKDLWSHRDPGSPLCFLKRNEAYELARRWNNG